MVSANTREVPDEVFRKYRTWQRLWLVWTWIHLATGGASVVCSTIIAFNVRQPFLSDTATLVIAILASSAAFLSLALNPQREAKGFRSASAHVEKAIAKYQFDTNLTTADLGRAVAEAVDMLS